MAGQVLEIEEDSVEGLRGGLLEQEGLLEDRIGLVLFLGHKVVATQRKQCRAVIGVNRETCFEGLVGIIYPAQGMVFLADLIVDHCGVRVSQLVLVDWDGLDPSTQFD